MKIILFVLTILFAPLAYSIDSDIRCLAKNIYHEARGETIKGQVAVALVTLNRSKHDDFPDSICSVVYEKGQFSWTSENYKVTHNEAWNNSVALAKQVLYGNIGQKILPNFKALYFHSSKVKPRWRLKSRPQRIGNHVFY